jgi:hypothetical protein
LKPNYSHIEYVHFPEKDPFMTNHKKDYIKFTHNKNAPLSDNKEFIRASKIVLGEYNHKTQPISTYNERMIDPKDQRSRFNYDKINFKYNEYNIHPITSEPIHKLSRANWSFDYFNKDKPKNFILPKNTAHINTDYTKVYDPITNRYFK